MSYFPILSKYTSDNQELRPLVEALGAFMGRYARDTTPEELETFLRAQNPSYGPKEKELYHALTENIAKCEVTEEVVSLLVQSLYKRETYKKLAVAAYEASEGRNDPETVRRLAEGLSKEAESPLETQTTFVTDDLEELYAKTVKEQGLRWRLNSLNTSLGSLRKGDFGFVFARPECFAKGTLVLLSDGRNIAIENIRAGMKVMGPDSKPRNVVATSKGSEKMYRVSYSWGDSYVCNESHMLQLRAEGKVTTSVKLKNYLTWSDKLKHRFKQYKVGIDLPHKSTKLDPYILGVWLGDGTSSGPQFTNADEEVISYLKEWARKNNLICSVYEREGQGKAKTISISSGTRKHGSNTFLQYLKSTRLLKNKHIPEIFLRNSREIRLQLLAGLIDTDGWREKNSYGFCNKNEVLINQIVWLARSLGFHATKNLKLVNGTPYYTVGIYGSCYEIPVRIIRKVITKNTDKRSKRNGLNFGFKIVEEPSITEYYGIQVDQDSLYLLNDFTVVHNTGKTTFLASECTFMASQASSPVVWFNNEEQGEKVMLRCYQAALGRTLEQLFVSIAEARTAFRNITKGNLKLVDQASISRTEVEEVCNKIKPSLIVFDQIDKIGGFKADRDDLVLGEIYQWARELAKTFCPVIGVCQADGTAEGVKWLTMAHVANAKTSKQAEADWILGIGRSNDVGYEAVRHFNISKNKLVGDTDTIPDRRHDRWDVLIEPTTARYKDIL